jgi:hypothetical protein
MVFPASGLNPGYAGTTVDNVLKKFDDMNGKQAGDIQKGCQVIYDAVEKQGKFSNGKTFLRLPLGKDAAKRIQTHLDTLQENLDGLKEVWESTDIEG